MTLNVELLDRTLARVEEEAAKPEGKCQWYQGAWRTDLTDRCGTAMCFAGWVVTLADEASQWISNDPESGGYDDLVPLPGEGSTHMVYDDLDRYVPAVLVSVRSARLLGIPSWEADRLYGGSNTLDDLRQVVRELKEEAEFAEGDRAR